MVKGMVFVRSGYLRFGGMPGNVLLGSRQKIKDWHQQANGPQRPSYALNKTKDAEANPLAFPILLPIGFTGFTKTSNLKREAALLVPVEQLALARFVWK